MITYKLSGSFQREYFDKMALQAGFLPCGVDEVGRGCLAGPVVAAAVILKPGAKGCRLDDSKLLTAQERERTYAWLMKNSWWGTAIVHHRTIDAVNIHQATLIAMKRACMQLIARHGKIPAFVLVDAMPLQLPEISFTHQTSDETDIFKNPWNKVIHFPFGERRSRSIAAASIIAKVTRDRLVSTLDPLFPGYSFTQHKGYGTTAHRSQLHTLGATVMHRQSFLSEKHRAPAIIAPEDNLNIFDASINVVTQKNSIFLT